MFSFILTCVKLLSVLSARKAALDKLAPEVYFRSLLAIHKKEAMEYETSIKEECAEWSKQGLGELLLLAFKVFLIHSLF